MNRIAIIGFGGAGYCAAAEVRKHDKTVQIDVYTSEKSGPHNPMLTTYYIKGSLPYEAMFPFGSLEEIENRLSLCVYRETRVTRVEPSEMAVFTADGTRRVYDKILICTGASPVVPKMPGCELPGVITMRNEQDAVRLRELIDSGAVRTGLVIGASWVGIKVVEDFAERGVPCIMMNRSKHGFSKALFPQTAERVEADLNAKGIHLEFGCSPDHFEAEGDGRISVVTKDDRRFTADVVAVASGVNPSVGFLKDSGIAVGKGIIVDSHMRTSCPDIYAAGDCCDSQELQSGQTRNIGLWQNAVRQGTVAGANMVGVPSEFGGNVLVNLAHYLHYDFLSVGDISLCQPEDEVYEYEDAEHYIRAVKGDGRIKCINTIGTAELNGVVKSVFIKSLENSEAGIDVSTYCRLKENSFPASFIEFIGGHIYD